MVVHRPLSLTALAGITLLVLIGLALSAQIVLGSVPTLPVPASAQQTPTVVSAGLIAFVLEDDTGSPVGGKADIYVANADGTNLHNLTNQQAFYDSLAWSPDGRKLAFLGNGSIINTINADGTQMQPLVSGLSPVWSPDGSRIAYMSTTDGNREIYVMTPYGRDQINLTNSSADEFDPQWSPDGSQIAFMASGGNGQDICVVDSFDGGNYQCLTSPLAGEIFPVWSPDGTQIAFVTHGDGNREIYVINADGSNPRRLTENKVEDVTPQWSPDGSQIAFASKQGDTFEIYVMNADGSNLRRLTENDVDDTLPRWSPDGRQIAFVSQADKTREVYVIDADGSHMTLLATADIISEPAWQPGPDAAGETPTLDTSRDVPVPEMVLVPGSMPGNVLN